MDTVADAKPVKVLYKDAEGINTFCINKVHFIPYKEHSSLFDSNKK